MNNTHILQADVDSDSDSDEQQQQQQAQHSAALAITSTSSSFDNIDRVDEDHLDYTLLVEVVLYAVSSEGEAALQLQPLEHATNSSSNSSLTGAVLVFLPGVLEISKLCRELERGRGGHYLQVQSILLKRLCGVRCSCGELYRSCGRQAVTASSSIIVCAVDCTHCCPSTAAACTAVDALSVQHSSQLSFGLSEISCLLYVHYRACPLYKSPM
jgi:hypothetical protein